MKHLFSPEGESVLASTMAQGPLLAFDFDGTLAPIVARPADARISTAVARRLERLAKVLPVAIISGRSVDDVRGRLAFEPRFILGNHGAEETAHAPDWSPVFDELRERLVRDAALLEAAGVSVEDKVHSLALHYRLARDADEALRAIGRVVLGLHPDVSVYGGKRVVNVVATAAPNKAQAVANLVARCGNPWAVFVGDDVNDEPVFARREPTWLTIRVGRDDPASQARYFLDNALEVATMLDRMTTLVKAYER